MILAFHGGRQERDPSRAVKPTQVQTKVACQLANPAVQGGASRSHCGGEPKAVVFHQTQRLDHIWHNASSQQLAGEEQIFVVEIVEAVDDKWVHSVVEPVAVVGATTDVWGVVINVRHLSAR